MSLQLKNIKDKALSLSPNEKEILIQSLINSLENLPITDIDESWIIEAEKRYDRYKKGITKGIPGEKIFSEIRQELGWQK
ncbi:addiction module protein [candidate division KSB1 bacterium]|nr:addiction module protein [candidate division KSB1 bacterium]